MRRGRDYDLQLPSDHRTTLVERWRHLAQAERWTLLAPNTEQCMRLPNQHSHFSSLGPSYFCAYHLTFDAFKLLCNSPDSVHITFNRGVSKELGQVKPQRATTEARLETLPPELIGIIFTSLEAPDFVALSLCSRTLWAQAITWAQSGYVRWKNAYSWAGTPMICVGSALHFLPQSIYDLFPTAIPDPVPQGLGLDEEHRLRANNRPRAWHDGVTGRYGKRPIPYDDHYREEFWKKITSAGIPQHFHELMAASFPTFSIERGTKWYLRNLAQKEYIRMEAIETDDGEFTVSFVGNYWLTLDILLMWLISWRGEITLPCSWDQLEQFMGVSNSGLGNITADSTFGPQDHDFWPILAGNWAGHSLDVVAEEVDEAWVDRSSIVDLVSKKLLRTIYGLAMAEVGGDEEAYWSKIFTDSGEVVNVRMVVAESDSEIGLEKRLAA